MALATTTAAILVTFIRPATDDATLKRFYRRVRPFGFWRHAAGLNGVAASTPLRALGIRLGAMAVTAVSLFCLLVGVGRWLFAAPSGNASVGWGCLALGLLLIPVWLRIAIGRHFDDNPVDEPLTQETPAGQRGVV